MNPGTSEMMVRATSNAASNCADCDGSTCRTACSRIIYRVLHVLGSPLEALSPGEILGP